MLPRLEHEGIVSKSQFSTRDLVPYIFPQQEQGVYAVMGFYADDSTTHPKNTDYPSVGQLQTAAAVIGWPVNFWEAECLWEKHLENAGIEYFRASESEMLEGEFDLAKSPSLNSARARADATRRDLISVFEKIPLTTVAVSLLLDDFRDVISNNAKARYYYGSDPTVLVCGHLIKTTIELIHQDHPEWVGHSLACTFDEHANYLKYEAAYDNLKRKDWHCNSMMGYVGHADDKDHSPIQMADLLAYEARYKSAQTIAKHGKERWAFKLLDEQHMFYYIGAMDKKGLLSQLDDYPDPPADGSPNQYKWTLD
jgi:hypothetical protein